MKATFCAILFVLWSGLSAHASTVACSTKTDKNATDEGPTFFFEDGVIKLIDFQGTVSEPFENGQLCNIPVSKDTGDTAVELTTSDSLLTFEVDIAGFVVNKSTDEKRLASTGRIAINRTLSSGEFSCSYENDIQLTYYLTGCVFE